MPAATNKADLLVVTLKDYAKLAKLIEGIDEAVAGRKVEEDTSIKDVVAHRAHWIGLYLGWYSDGIAGRDVHMPAKGYKWSELKAYSARLREDHAGLSWDDARAALAERHAALVAFVERHSEAELYGAPMIGHDKWSAGRFAEASGASHYRSAAKFIRKALKSN